MDTNFFTVTDSASDSVSFTFYSDGSIDVDTEDALDGESVSVSMTLSAVRNFFEAYQNYIKDKVPEGDTVPTPIFGGATPTSIVEGEPASWNLAAARAAEALKLTLNFRYSKSDHDPIESRRIKVENVIETTTGDHLIVGTDPDRDNDVRSFRIDRIKGYASAGEG